MELLLTDVLVPRATLREPWWDEIPTTDDEDGQALGDGDGVATVREVASEYVERLRSQYSNTATLNAYMSPVMKHVGPFFAHDGERERRVDEITGGLVSHFTATKMAERELLTNLAATLAEFDDNDLRDPAHLRGLLDSEAEWDLLVRFGQRGGRLPLSQALGARDRGRISLSSRRLSNNEINRCLARLRDILELAREEFGVEMGDRTRPASAACRGETRQDPGSSPLSCKRCSMPLTSCSADARSCRQPVMLKRNDDCHYMISTPLHGRTGPHPRVPLLQRARLSAAGGAQRPGRRERVREVHAPGGHRAGVDGSQQRPVDGRRAQPLLVPPAGRARVLQAERDGYLVAAAGAPDRALLVPGARCLPADARRSQLRGRGRPRGPRACLPGRRLPLRSQRLRRPRA